MGAGHCVGKVFQGLSTQYGLNKYFREDSMDGPFPKAVPVHGGISMNATPGTHHILRLLDKFHESRMVVTWGEEDTVRD